jgi:hypothetical protein
MIRRFEDLDAARYCDTSETGSKLAIIITDEILGGLSIAHELRNEITPSRRNEEEGG